MIILIPSSEGKNRIKRPMEIKFKNTDLTRNYQLLLNQIYYNLPKQNINIIQVFYLSAVFLGFGMARGGTVRRQHAAQRA